MGSTSRKIHNDTFKPPSDSSDYLKLLTSTWPNEKASHESLQSVAQKTLPITLSTEILPRRPNKLCVVSSFLTVTQHQPKSVSNGTCRGHWRAGNVFRRKRQEENSFHRFSRVGNARAFAFLLSCFQCRKKLFSFWHRNCFQCHRTFLLALFVSRQL